MSAPQEAKIDLALAAIVLLGMALALSLPGCCATAWEAHQRFDVKVVPK